MWEAEKSTIRMSEGDYGVALPYTVNGITFSASDSLKLIIKKGGVTVLEKEYTNIANNTIEIVLTSAESALLTVGSYRYNLDWYRDGVFMCNLVSQGLFRVGGK